VRSSVITVFANLFCMVFQEAWPSVFSPIWLWSANLTKFVVRSTSLPKIWVRSSSSLYPIQQLLEKTLNKASIVFSCNGYFVEGILFHTSSELILSLVQVLRSYSTDASNYWTTCWTGCFPFDDALLGRLNETIALPRGRVPEEEASKVASLYTELYTAASTW
jgi:hypothetical protein